MTHEQSLSSRASTRRRVGLLHGPPDIASHATAGQHGPGISHGRYGAGVLRIPGITLDTSLADTTQYYAEEGWFVVPITQRTKHPGSVLGTGWPQRSSRDADQLEAWFGSSSHGLALHVGRSGAVAFDVDRPELVPPVLREVMDATDTPFQSSRVGQPGRGHWVFSLPPGVTLGNSTGRLGGLWGEVRGETG